MDGSSIETVAQLGGTVFTVCVFVWYLYQKNGKSERAMKSVTDSLERIHQSQEQHTRVLMRVAEQHGNHRDADELMSSK